ERKEWAFGPERGARLVGALACSDVAGAVPPPFEPRSITSKISLASGSSVSGSWARGCSCSWPSRKRSSFLMASPFRSLNRGFWLSITLETGGCGKDSPTCTAVRLFYLSAVLWRDRGWDELPEVRSRGGSRWFLSALT